jgi:alpha-beta hydrolase superfamily lysophospholipase
MNILRSGFNLFLGLGVLLAIAYLTICLFLFFRQNRLIFFPTSVLTAKPSDLNLAYEDVWISVGESHHPLHSWWIPAAGEPVGVVLHLHGNGYNIGANLSQAVQFHRLGLSVLMLDYRGYGLSQGDFPTEASVYQDARAAWNYLTQTQQISPDRIFLFGHSLGGAIAIDLAITLPTTAGLIVQSSFTSMRRMVDQMGQFWMFPIDLLLTHHPQSVFFEHTHSLRSRHSRHVNSRFYERTSLRRQS